jgi:hypothetical protein
MNMWKQRIPWNRPTGVISCVHCIGYALPRKAGLRRCGKSCRLRWLNYLRPGVRHGGFSPEEDRVICALYDAVGSRWSLIAAHLPGRTDNGVKNYWNTRLKKRFHLLFGVGGMPPPRRPRDADVSAVPVPPSWTTGLLPCGTGGGVDDTRIIGAGGGGSGMEDDMVTDRTNAVVVSQLQPAETSRARGDLRRRQSSTRCSGRPWARPAVTTVTCVRAARRLRRPVGIIVST